MSFRENYLESRARFVATYSGEEVDRYDNWVKQLTVEDHLACLSDLQTHVDFKDEMKVLDAGAGTGGLCLSLALIPGLAITALEPCEAMLTSLRSKPELKGIVTVPGFCDHPSDHSLFPAESFDLIASRQLINCLFDPLAAFQNWYSWLRPSGTVVVIDGLYDRNAWTGVWDGTVDTLPLSACRSTATVPYLLEHVGFEVTHVGMMTATNERPSTRTARYMVSAKKREQ